MLGPIRLTVHGNVSEMQALTRGLPKKKCGSTETCKEVLRTAPWFSLKCPSPGFE